jgi:hypothetical protein
MLNVTACTMSHFNNFSNFVNYLYTFLRWPLEHKQQTFHKCITAFHSANHPPVTISQPWNIYTTAVQLMVLSHIPSWSHCVHETILPSHTQYLMLGHSSYCNILVHQVSKITRFKEWKRLANLMQSLQSLFTCQNESCPCLFYISLHPHIWRLILHYFCSYFWHTFYSYCVNCEVHYYGI